MTIEWALTGLPTDVVYTAIGVRASNEKGFSPETFAAVRPAHAAQPRLDFAHFANGASITFSLVFVNVATHPIRPALYFTIRRVIPLMRNRWWMSREIWRSPRTEP